MGASIFSLNNVIGGLNAGIEDDVELLKKYPVPEHLKTHK